MAPILAAPTGMTTQPLQNEFLRQLLTQMQSLSTAESDMPTTTLPQLITLLDPFRKEETDEPSGSLFFVEDQIDLVDWIHPLNVLDAALKWILLHHSQQLLLVEPVLKDRATGSRRKSRTQDFGPEVEALPAAQSMDDVQKLPPMVQQALAVILAFTTVLLRNASGHSKSVYQSIYLLLDLLAAAQDHIADEALATLHALAVPSAMHKQPPSEHQVPTTALHQTTTEEHSRLAALARGWGTRAMGLGLLATVAADDSVHGQGQLTSTTTAGQLNFGYYHTRSTKIGSPENDAPVERACEDEGEEGEGAAVAAVFTPNRYPALQETVLIRISLTEAEILETSSSLSSTTSDEFVGEMEDSPELPSSPQDMSIAASGSNANDVLVADLSSSKKRRRVSSRQIAKPSAELFFMAVEKLESSRCHHSEIPYDRLFALLVDIRLARCFHSQSTRITAVKRRLRALCIILHTHPSQDIISGYFQAQPELTAEIVDLLRPTVSSANVSAATMQPGQSDGSEYVSGTVASFRQDPMAALAGEASQPVPYIVRLLALDTLTALFSPRNGGGGVSGSTRLSSILTELGVSKGQYLGLLPTLIRFSLAALGSTAEYNHQGVASHDESSTTDLAMAVGLAFLEATMAPSLPRIVQVERVLHFIESILTLTSSVISTPTGTSALVDCGLVPTLLATASLDPANVLSTLIPDLSHTDSEVAMGLQASFRFVLAQVLQIIEGCIATNSNALSAFHDLQGVDVLVSTLCREVGPAQGAHEETTQDVTFMEVEMVRGRHSTYSQKVLLFSLFTCLAQAFHNESGSAVTTTTSAGAVQLQRPELTSAMLEILNNVESYGGNLVSFVATLLSDVMNTDPHVVHYVHKSGLALSFLRLVMGKREVDKDGVETYEPTLPAVSELIMSIPNVISALALTEDGAKFVHDMNPFSSFLKIFYHPRYAMPQSRCLLNEMTAIVGTGLYEVMRHVERLKPLVMKAVCKALYDVVRIGEQLVAREDEAFSIRGAPQAIRDELESERTCLIQYVLNFCQLLEQVLHNEDHCQPFTDEGGFEALLRLYPSTMPSGVQFIAHVSSMSSPSVSTIHHSTIEQSLAIACKSINQRINAAKLVKCFLSHANIHLDSLEEARSHLFGSLTAELRVHELPDVPFYLLSSDADLCKLRLISAYLRCMANVQWITAVLSSAIVSICQRNQDSSGWSSVEREWKKELTSESFRQLMNRASTFYHASTFDICQIRTEDKFTQLELDRMTSRNTRLRYRLRIVCPEGAVVRDGIDIDSCANVGNMEMGEIVDSFDRCVNSSGILRYRTVRGWVSEMTRGHGREPIAEVISLWETEDDIDMDVSNNSKGTRIEAGIPDLRTLAVGILARGQASYSLLLSSISKVVTQSIQGRTLGFGDGTAGENVANLVQLHSSCLQSSWSYIKVEDTEGEQWNTASRDAKPISEAGAAMFLSSTLSYIHQCVFDDKRERRNVNFPLLVSLFTSDEMSIEGDDRSSRIVQAMKFILKHCLADGEARAHKRDNVTTKPRQRVGRSVASSLPPVVDFARRLLATPLALSPSATTMSRLKWSEVTMLLGSQNSFPFKIGADDETFVPEVFSRGLQAALSDSLKEIWIDRRIQAVPSYIVHQIASLTGDLMVALDDMSKTKSTASVDRPNRSQGRMLLSDLIRRQRQAGTGGNGPFEPSENAITQMMEMGFSREHAIDALESTQSNRVEVAMDYALTNPPPSLATIERRRAEREERASRRAGQSAPEVASSGFPGGNGEDREEETAVAQARALEASASDPATDSSKNENDGTSTDSDLVAQNEDDPIKQRLEAWVELIPDVCISIMSAIRPSDGPTHEMGDGEAEALTAVLSSFLLDLGQKYPTCLPGALTKLLKAVNQRLVTLRGETSGFCAQPEIEFSTAALCHAALLFSRALPKMRINLLKEDIVSGIITCIQKHLDLDGDVDRSLSGLPIWLTPAVLLLDTMAQPLVGFTSDNMTIDDSEMTGQDYQTVLAEHRTQVKELSRAAAQVFAAIQVGLKARDLGATDAPKEGNDDSEVAYDGNSAEFESVFASTPSYFPLLSDDQTRACMQICWKLLLKSRDPQCECILSPGLAHGLLLLLLHLLRSPSLSGACLRMGFAEAILNLSKESRFIGNSGLITLVLRRLLEDDLTLQTVMENEIRNLIYKPALKKGNTGIDGEKQWVGLSSFLESITPLLCRDPICLLRAMVLSVKIIPKGADHPTPRVFLLSQEERAKAADVVARVFANQAKPADSAIGSDGNLREDASKQRRSTVGTKKEKSPARNSRRLSSSKKARKERPDGKMSHLHESPSAHVTSLIITAISMQWEIEEKYKWDHDLDRRAFLSTGELLDMLADLLLAVPVCCVAMYNHRAARNRSRMEASLHVVHALNGSPPPPKTFVSFLLHAVLPQDKWALKNDQQIWLRKKEDDQLEAKMAASKRADAHRILKVSQAAARVLLALVSRPGECRRRVFAELSFALSAGRLGAVGPGPISDVQKLKMVNSDNELHALQAWGELCLGFAAPRSNGKNYESASVLSLENLKLMLEQGIAHSLLYATHRVNLLHAMAPITFKALLYPLEVVTRASVTDAITESLTKAALPKSAAEVPRGSHVSSGTQPSFEDYFTGGNDQSLEHDEFISREQHGEGAVEYEVVVGGEVVAMDVEAEDDGEIEEDEEMDEENSLVERQSEEESEEETTDDEDDESEENELEDEEEASDMDDGEDDDEVPSEGMAEEDAWGPDYEIFPAEHQDQPDYQEVEDEGTDRMENEFDDGWTRIDPPGLGQHSGPNIFLNDPRGPRRTGFLDAAEAMIGSLIESGEINGETLAQIEGSLGIRVVSGEGPFRTGTGNEDSRRRLGEPIIRVLVPDPSRTPARGAELGTFPYIHQRSHNDSGSSSYGRGGQWVDISSMEFVFGGPSVTAGNRNYDLVSPLRDETDIDTQLNLSQMDLQLFPTGPLAASSARTQYSIHPMLCGVDLPPLNSLVAELLPHGVRATRPGQMTTRRAGDMNQSALSPGGYLVTTSAGNIIRSSRLNQGAPMSLSSGLGTRRYNSPGGWVVEDAPVDVMGEEFASTFLRALGELMSRENPAEQRNSNAERGVVDGRPPEENLTPSGETNSTMVGSRPDSAEGSVNDGDRVASSLASGLRLSPSHASVASEPIPVAQLEESAAPLTGVREESAGLPEEVIMDDVAQEDFATVETPQVISNQGSMMFSQGDDFAVAVTSQSDGVREAENFFVADRLVLGSETINENGLVCPPDIDAEIFNSLPEEMQREFLEQYNATRELEAQLDGSTLSPAVLAELPEEVRREVIEQDRLERERRTREQQGEAPADPSRAGEMDDADILASLSPELREEILISADEAFLRTLPPSIVAEAHLLRERATQRYESLPRVHPILPDIGTGAAAGQSGVAADQVENSGSAAPRKKQRSGKIRVEADRESILYLPDSLSVPFARCDLRTLVSIVYLLSPVRPAKLLQRLFQNLCANPTLRSIVASSFIHLLHENGRSAANAIRVLEGDYGEKDDWRRMMDRLFDDNTIEFPPHALFGAIQDAPDGDSFDNINLSSTLLRSHGASQSLSSTPFDCSTPPIVASRLLETILQICKGSPRFCLHLLVTPIRGSSAVDGNTSCFEKLVALLNKPLYARSAANLEQLLTVLENAVSPLSHISRDAEDEADASQRDVENASVSGKELVDVPRVAVSQRHLELLCSTLRMEACRDSATAKVNTIVRRLCRVEANRGFVLAELASVAHALGEDAKRDLQALRIRMDDAVADNQRHAEASSPELRQQSSIPGKGAVSSSVTLSTSTSEIKLLRVLQTLQALCGENSDESGSKKNEGSVVVTEELVELLRQLNFDDLWDELSSCLRVVQLLEGVKSFEESEQKESEDAETNDEGSGEENVGKKSKQLRNSVAGLLTRFLPSIEAFFVANASATRSKAGTDNETTTAVVTKHGDISADDLVGGKRVIEFVSTNKVLLNALVRNNSGLLDKGLRAMVQVPSCRVYLDFDVKRQWFKGQLRRMRLHASRRHGNLRLVIRRQFVFEDAYHQLRLRNAEEMRGRLHITFRDEEGVDAGGLSREFFGILAREIFNPNYALFTSTEDGCTFQPNPSSSINPDHLSYFRFVGRIVGKAVSDGFLLDVHFTRSLYKHMLGLEPTHHDMEAIDPDYYRNLKTILEFNLADIGLDLTFSIEDHSFGRNQVIDLIPNGRRIAVTEANKEEYVRLICQHRMTTAIQSQIRAYLDGFYELVSADLITIFTPRELELLISGLPDIDVHDLKANTEYVGWKASDPEIGWFWSILFSLSRNEKAAFLQFVTGSSKVPLAGFSELQGMRGVQKFSIHKVSNSAKGALMSAHTCFNSLDLPSTYKSEEEMRERLLYAIHEGAACFLIA